MTEQRTFTLPIGSLTMSERRIMASKFGVNWDAIEVDLTEMPRHENPDELSEDDKREIARFFTRIIGPNERFALLYVAVKRVLPAATEAEIERRADAEEWLLALGEEEASGPLGEATETTGTTSSETS